MTLPKRPDPFGQAARGNADLSTAAAGGADHPRRAAGGDVGPCALSLVEARSIAKVGLANYFAGAALMPYGAFLAAAQDTRHDLELLAPVSGPRWNRSHTGCRPCSAQAPKACRSFSCVSIRRAPSPNGTRPPRLQFARFGGACPLWNVHAAFETPRQFLRQLAETPDGARYFCLARDVSRPGGSYHAPMRRYAIGLGCEVRHANALVYADHMDTAAPDAYAPIGISCRICERKQCHQRSVPPIARRLRVDPDMRGVLPYQID